MKLRIAALLLCLALLSGCGAGDPAAGEDMADAPEAEEPPEGHDVSEDASEELRLTSETLFEAMAGDYRFSSGVGAWGTELTVEADGTFSGLFVDSDMGTVGEGYPDGTRYVCSFSGSFTQPEQVNEYTWSMEIEQISLEDPPGREEYADCVRYIYAGPYGLENAEELLVYLPSAETADLPEDFLFWVRVYGDVSDDGRLGCYGIYNVHEAQGFVGPSEKA